MIVLGPHETHLCEPATSTHYRCLTCDLMVSLPEPGQTTMSLSADLHDQDMAADLSVKTEFGL